LYLQNHYEPGGAKAPPPVFKEDKVMAFFNSAIGVLQTRY